MSTQTKANYQLQGMALEVALPDDSIRQAVDTILSYHGVEASDGHDNADWNFDFSFGHLLEPLDPRKKSASNAYGIDVYELESETVLEHQQVRAVVSRDTDHVLFLLDENMITSESGLVHGLFVIVTLSLLTLLQRRGLFAIHGAALATKDGRAVVIVGPSDSGKSTLSLNIAMAGWDYLSDDSILLWDNGSRIEVRPFRRHFGVDPDAAGLFPQIKAAASQMLTDPDKWQLDTGLLFEGKLVESADPQVIIFPTVVDADTSEFVRIPQIDAITHLMTQGTFIEAGRQIATRQMNLFAKLVSQCGNYRLKSGRDIKKNPQLVNNLMLDIMNEDTPDSC